MSKEQNTKKTAEQDMLFITSVTTLATPGVAQHSGVSGALTKKAEEVKNDFTVIMNQLNYIVTEADKSSFDNQFKLDEITVSLGFSAKGKLGFIAEAGVEASIEVKFTRK